MTKDGTQTGLYTIENSRFRLCATDYGAALVSFTVKELNRDIVLGYRSVSGYEANGGCLGATIGRVCNRIENAEFQLHSKVYRLIPNHGPNNLHSGPDGYHHRMFKAEQKKDCICFSLYSPDGDQGFPGNIELKVIYQLDQFGFRYRYEAVSDRDTYVNITNHTYWNLSSDHRKTADSFLICSDADQYLSIDTNGLADGPLKKTANTGFDLSVTRRLADCFTDPELASVHGFDHPFFVPGSGMRKMVQCADDGLLMTVYSDLPGFQLYTANGLSVPADETKEQIPYGIHSGICFETQYSPNAMNRTDVDIPLLKSGNRLVHETEYRFCVLNSDYLNRQTSLREYQEFLDGMEMIHGEKGSVSKEAERTRKLLNRIGQFIDPDQPVAVIKSPGRIEIGGNHTDHQNGKVLAAAVSKDCKAVVSGMDEVTVIYRADGYDLNVSIENPAVLPEDRGSTSGLIRGVAQGFLERGFKIGGFVMYSDNQVLPGSGMSSSASFELLIANAFNILYNNGAVPAETMAEIGRFAEHAYFGKPCGLMDQLTIAEGGFVFIDFKDPEHPAVRTIDFDFEKNGYAVILTDCHSDHSELVEEYASIPREMKSVAELLGYRVLSEVTPEKLLGKTAQIRSVLSDRAFLRAYHFVTETARAEAEAEALAQGDIGRFLQLVNESGRSSFEYLQNVHVDGDSKNQSLAIGLALSEAVLNGSGAWRVHGGGFAGSILAFVPHDRVDAYIALLEDTFGDGSCHRLEIGASGAGISL